MNPDQALYRELVQSDEAGRVALTRFLCERILGDDPEHVPTLIRYASCLIDLSLYDQANAIIDRAETLVPEERLHLVLAQRGHLFKAMGNFVGAESQYMSAHDLDSDDATYLIYAGSAAFARGDIGRAEELARAAILCSEGCIDEAYFNLGGYLLAKKQYTEAKSCYIRAIEIDPNYGIAKARLEDLEILLRYQGE